MKTIRYLLSIVVLAALGAGYFGSQVSYINRTPSQWAAGVDTAPIVWLSLLVLAAAIVLWFIPDKEEQ
jgi:hypothetical protein